MASMIEPAFIRPPGSDAEARKFFLLLSALVMREWKGRYRRSALGPLWAILYPILYMSLFVFLRRVANLQVGNIPYIAFVMAGLAPWTFLANSITRSATIIASNATVVKKISAAREVFPLSVVIVSLLDCFFSFFVLTAVMIYYRIPVGMNLLWLPMLIAITAILAFGLGMAVAAYGTYRTDVTFVVPLVIQLWMFASPVMYALSNVPVHMQNAFYRLNPMVGLLESFRRILLFNQPPAWDLLGYATIGCVLILAFAWPYFRAVSQYFADVL